MATAARQVEQPAGWDMQEPDSSSESGGLLPPTDSGGGGPPVTVTIQQRVGRAQVDAFLKWEKGITAANEQFDGFVSTTVLREPIGPQGEGEGQGDQLFVTIIKYVDFASARRWNQSEERKAWLDKLEQIGLSHLAKGSGPATIDFSGFPVFTGLMSLRSAEVQPPRWRMWLLIWLQVYSLVELYELVLPALFGHARWSDYNLHLKFVLGTFCTTVTIEYLTHKPLCWLSTLIGFLPSPHSSSSGAAAAASSGGDASDDDDEDDNVIDDCDGGPGQSAAA